MADHSYRVTTPPLLSNQVGSALDLRADASFFAMTPSGQTALHRKTDRHFVDPRDFGSDTLKKAANEMLSGISGEVIYEFDNAVKNTIYRTSSLTQWKFALTFSTAAQK